MCRSAYSKKYTIVIFLIALMGSSGVSAQLERREEGFEAGPFIIRPQVGAGISYDNRALIIGETAEEDVYSEIEAGVAINNRPAAFQFKALASYGYRAYSEYTDLNDDFYRLNAVIGTDEGRLNWKLGTDYRKRLDYDATYNPYTGDGPDSILSDQPNIRSETRATVSYEVPVSERTYIEPEYGLWHYYQEFIGDSTEEWQVHRIRVPLNYEWTEKTVLSAGGGVALQANKQEDGTIGTLYVGAKSRATEKTTYSIYVGLSAADYELSGKEYGGVSDGRVVWDASEKVSAYLFGGNRFEPGYSGQAARMVYRAGYGLNWKMATQWALGGQGLHNFEEAIGSGNTNDIYGDVQSFFTVRLSYTLPRWAVISLSGRYSIDEQPENKTIVSLRADFSF